MDSFIIFVSKCLIWENKFTELFFPSRNIGPMKELPNGSVTIQVCARGLFTSLKTVSFGKMLLSFRKMFLY